MAEKKKLPKDNDKKQDVKKGLTKQAAGSSVDRITGHNTENRSNTQRMGNRSPAGASRKVKNTKTDDVLNNPISQQIKRRSLAERLFSK